MRFTKRGPSPAVPRDHAAIGEGVNDLSIAIQATARHYLFPTSLGGRMLARRLATERFSWPA